MEMAKKGDAILWRKEKHKVQQGRSKTVVKARRQINGNGIGRCRRQANKRPTTSHLTMCLYIL